MQRLIEGVSFDKDSDQFRFDFSSDNSEDFVRLVSDGPYELKEYSPCTYFGYVFEKNTPKDTKAKFINAIKFPDNEKNISKEDLTGFIRNAVYQLDKKVSLSKYDCIVYPQSSSKLNSWLIEEIGNISLSDKFVKYGELLNEVPIRQEVKQKLQSKNVLVIDDIFASMNNIQHYFTVTEILNVMRFINTTNQITIFYMPLN